MKDPDLNVSQDTGDQVDQSIDSEQEVVTDKLIVLTHLVLAYHKKLGFDAGFFKKRNAGMLKYDFWRFVL
ncbi:MAG: hypothetical protein ACFFD4_37040 [Candidatus Odinarchaeota archaeon]